MQWWLQTRGRQIDYPQGTLSPYGPLPPWGSAWWQGVQDATTPEEPMLLVETLPSSSGAVAWRLYVTAVDAGRRDGYGRAIRTSLLACGGPAEEKLLGLLLATWWDGRLAAHLREQLSEDELETWLSEQTPPPSIDALLDDLLWDLPEPVPVAPTPLGRGAWGGAASAADCQTALIAHALRSLRDGRHGLFCWLNLLETVEEARPLAALRRPDVTILLLDSDELHGTLSLAGAQGALGPPNPPVAGPPPPRAETGLLQWVRRVLASIFGTRRAS